MREYNPSPKRRRKKRGCMGRFFSFLLVIAIVVCVGYWMAEHYDIKTRILRTQYPLKYQSIVETNAQKYGLEKELVYAMIRTESKFDPYAVSATGARGLMQIQEETAEECIRELKLTGITPDSLFEPEVNISLGCYYFSKLLKQYQGSYVNASAAYNGGPGRVNQWLKDKDNVDEKGDLIQIPISETQNYVKRIQESYRKYQELYSE